jgi:hypothetical protein
MRSGTITIDRYCETVNTQLSHQFTPDHHEAGCDRPETVHGPCHEEQPAQGEAGFKIMVCTITLDGDFQSTEKAGRSE